jgi:hypothetical protein
MMHWIAALLLLVQVAARATPTVVATFDATRGEHAENIAVGKDGTAYVTLLSDTIYVRHADGSESRLATGAGVNASATGIAINRKGQLIVGIDRHGQGKKGIWRIDPKIGITNLLFTLPESVMVNGVAIDDEQRIYVADSRGGAIWRASGDGGTPRIWFRTREIAAIARVAMPVPGAPVLSVGPNGLRYRAGTLFVSVSGQHRLIAIPIDRRGRAGLVRTVIHDLFIDDFGFDAAGHLVVTADARQLLTTQVIHIDSAGHRTILVSGLQQPSAVAANLASGQLYVTTLGLFGMPQRPALITLDPEQEGELRR